MSRNPYYVKTCALHNAAPCGFRALPGASKSAVQKMRTLPPYPHVRQRGDLAQNFSEIRWEK